MSVRRRMWRDPKTGAPKEAWIVDFVFQHADGRKERVRETAPKERNTRRGAEEWEHILVDRLKKQGSKKEVPTFQEFTEKQWLPVYPASVGNRPSTVHDRECHIRLYLTPALGSLRLDQLKGEPIDKLFAGLRDKGLSAKTIKDVRGTLHRILTSAVDWEVLDSVPRLPKIKVPEAPWDFLTPEESDALVNAARTPEERALFLFALRTGARAGEQLAIEWGDVDRLSRKIIIRRASSRGVVGPTKTGRSRKVPLSAALEKALDAIKVRPIRGQLIFCEADGSPLKLDHLRQMLLGALRRAGLRHIRWHDLRHSFASQLMMANVPIRQVQEWMGHSTITMTMRYAHLAPGSGSDLINVLDAPPPVAHTGHKETGPA